MEWYHVWWPWLTSKCVARFVSDSWVSCISTLLLCDIDRLFGSVGNVVYAIRTPNRMCGRRVTASSPWPDSNALVQCLVHGKTNQNLSGCRPNSNGRQMSQSIGDVDIDNTVPPKIETNIKTQKTASRQDTFSRLYITDITSLVHRWGLWTLCEASQVSVSVENYNQASDAAGDAPASLTVLPQNQICTPMGSRYHKQKGRYDIDFVRLMWFNFSDSDCGESLLFAGDTLNHLRRSSLPPPPKKKCRFACLQKSIAPLGSAILQF